MWLICCVRVHKRVAVIALVRLHALSSLLTHSRITLQGEGNQVFIVIRAKPNSSRTAITGVSDDEVAVAVAEPAQDGRFVWLLCLLKLCRAVCDVLLLMRCLSGEYALTLTYNLASHEPMSTYARLLHAHNSTQHTPLTRTTYARQGKCSVDRVRSRGPGCSRTLRGAGQGCQGTWKDSCCV